MAHNTPLVSNGVLTFQKMAQEQQIPVGSPSWWQWLSNDSTTTFRFSDQQGSFTARREWKRSGWYWYAYRKEHGKLHKAYLGKAEELELAHLSTIATLLVQYPQTDHNTRNLLLMTRFFPPPLRPDAVPRPHLIERLEASLHCKLTLLSAPAGFGKSTLLSTWCEIQKRRHACAWLSLDKEDNDPVRFWTYVLAALDPICPEIGEQVVPLAQSSSPPAVETMLTMLINVLTVDGRVITLILDDYHVIIEQQIHDALTFLLAHLPPHVHLVVASRTEPPLPCTRLRAQGQLSEFHATDLRFSSAEVTTFLTQAMGLNLTPEEITSLDEQTEGWIAGLQLAALSIQGQNNVSAVISSFSGSHRYILDYLTGEVLNNQPAHVREFLLQTSILERLNAQLCDTVTGRSDGQTMLEWLERANLFLIPLDEKRQWYRYHHLFATFLRDRLRQLHAELLPELHKRASAWYEQYGLISTTVDHALLSRNMEHVAQLVERFAPIMFMRGEVITFKRWLDALPPAIIHSHPRLLIFLAASLLSIGQLDQAEAYVREVSQTLERQKQAAHITEDQRAELQEIEGELLGCASVLAAFRGDLPQTIALSQQALNLLSSDNLFTRSTIITGLGSAYLFSGEIDKAYETFQQAITLGESTQNYHVVLASMACQGYLQATEGHLQQAAALYQQTIRFGTRQGGRLFSVVSMVYVLYGMLLYEWNELEMAERFARDGIRVGDHWGYVGMLAQGYGVLAYVKYARGESTEALALIQQAEREVRNYTHPYVTGMVATYHAWLQLHTGHSEATAQWAHTLEHGTHTSPGHLHNYEMALLAELSIAQDQLVRAYEITEQVLASAEATKDTRPALDCLLLQAIIFHLQGQREQALSILARVLTRTEPEGFIRTYVDKGEPMAALLQQAAARGITPIYTRKLLAAFKNTPADQEALVESVLSEREIKVLSCIAAGKSNQAIAHELVIEVSTVKTHVNNIFTKLGVHSRTQAVARAKELGVLQ